MILYTHRVEVLLVSDLLAVHLALVIGSHNLEGLGTVDLRGGSLSDDGRFLHDHGLLFNDLQSIDPCVILLKYGDGIDI